MGLNDTIEKAIRWKVPVVDGRDTLRTVIELMNKENVTALTVKDDQETIIGVITDMDVTEALVKDGDVNRIKVKDIMTSCRLISDETIKSPCAQLDVNETILNAFKVMESGGIHHLMVSNDNKVGMIAISDLLIHVLD